MTDENNIKNNETLRAEMYSDIIDAHASFKNPKKGESGYNYKFANLPSTLQELKPILHKFNLAPQQLLQKTDDGDYMLELYLIHRNGMRTEASYFPFKVEPKKGMSPEQSVGTAITYYRRYQLQTFFGICGTDDDIDGAGEVVEAEPEKESTIIKKGKIQQSNAQNKIMESERSELVKECLEKISRLGIAEDMQIIGFDAEDKKTALRTLKSFLKYSDDAIMKKIKAFKKQENK